MKSSLPWIILGAFLWAGHSPAIENGSTGTFNESAPTGSDIPGWNAGWTQPSGQSGITGWNYVGIVAAGGGSASGVYLGNGWVLTAGHVGAATFSMGSAQYTVVPGTTYQNFTWTHHGTVYTADLTLFQVQPDGVTSFALPNLPALPIITSAPPVGSAMAMIGYGDGNGVVTTETWGLNNISAVNQQVDLTGYSYVSNDIETVYQDNGNASYLVVGDSGGGDFVYNSSSGQWQLVGINEALDGNNSYFVQLNRYAAQINAITSSSVPALPRWGLVALPVAMLLVGVHFLARKPTAPRLGAISGEKDAAA